MHRVPDPLLGYYAFSTPAPLLGYYVYCTYGRVVNGEHGVAELIRAEDANEPPRQAQHYIVGEFPDALVRPLDVVPFYLVPGRLTAVFREHDWDEEPDFRYPIMRKIRKGGCDIWVTRGIISGPKGDADERIRDNINRICQQRWGR